MEKRKKKEGKRVVLKISLIKFQSCEKITNAGVKNLAEALKTLNFQKILIYDMGLRHLSQGMRHLTSLKNVHMNFSS